jgi:leader peptidase (prepilin peptidase)/N-methyltransferase
MKNMQDLLLQLNTLYFLMYQFHLYFILAILFVIGAVVGSFLNVVIYRLPIMVQQNNQNKTVYNLLTPRSQCTHCNHVIPWRFNIPIIGYYLTKRKCHYCHIGISFSYPLIELLTALLFLISPLLTHDILILLAILTFVSISLALIIIDCRHLILPDQLTLPLLWLGLVFNLHGMFAGNLENAVIGAICGYLFLWSIYWVFKLITKREGMGYGDFKFLSAILAWTGYHYLPYVILLSALSAIIYFIIATIFTKQITQYRLTSLLQQAIPFGPFLGITGIICVCFNQALLHYWL